MMRGRKGHAPARAAHGFTLLELLVCIAVVALLVSILMPALQAAQQAARATVCLATMRRLGMVTRLYVDEHDYLFPQPIEDQQLVAIRGSAYAARVLWFNAIDPYLGLKPLAYRVSDEQDRHNSPLKQDPVWQSFGQNSRLSNRTIKMNACFGDQTAGGYHFYHPRQVRSASTTVLYIDGRARDITGSDGFIAKHFYATAGVVGLRHQGAANIGFVDGHAAPIRQAVRPDLAAPGWYPDDASGDDRVIWNFHAR